MLSYFYLIFSLSCFQLLAIRSLYKHSVTLIRHLDTIVRRKKLKFPQLLFTFAQSTKILPPITKSNWYALRKRSCFFVAASPQFGIGCELMRSFFVHIHNLMTDGKLGRMITNDICVNDFHRVYVGAKNIKAFNPFRSGVRICVLLKRFFLKMKTFWSDSHPARDIQN